MNVAHYVCDSYNIHCIDIAMQCIMSSSRFFSLSSQVADWRVGQAGPAVTTVETSCHQQLQTGGQPYLQCKKWVWQMFADDHVKQFSR